MGTCQRSCLLCDRLADPAVLMPSTSVGLLPQCWLPDFQDGCCCQLQLHPQSAAEAMGSALPNLDHDADLCLTSAGSSSLGSPISPLLAFTDVDVDLNWASDCCIRLGCDQTVSLGRLPTVWRSRGFRATRTHTQLSRALPVAVLMWLSCGFLELFGWSCMGAGSW